MKRRILWLCCLTLSLSAFGDGDLDVSGDRIRAHVKYLASDALEGRGVGTRGEQLATEYLAAQLGAEGVKPGGEDGTYFQRVPLVGSMPVVASASLKVHSEGSDFELSFPQDFVGNSFAQQPDNDFDAEAVFVGHGISAPEFHWDDYKGADLRGKVLVYFTNEPPSDDPSFFAGRALTYYGRWTYKFEEATRRGAVAAIIIHTTPTAGYGWPTVRGSWSQDRPEVKLEPGKTGLKLAAWVTAEAGTRLTAGTGKSLDELLALANRADFHPIPLGVRIRGHIPVKLREISSRNVIGRVAGADPLLSQEAVLFTAHWDHLGRSVPVNGDDIYNGAVDNATGCAMVLEMARIWQALPHKPSRSALFIFVTAEESGLLGSEYYGRHPLVAAGKTAVDLNFDAFYPFGPTRDVFVSGAERTTLWPLVQRDAKTMGLEVKADAEPEQGFYYRSDHFSLARVGVPAFSLEGGRDYVGKPADFGKTVFQTYNEQHYHQPSDEYHEDWDVAGMEQMARFGLRLGLDIASEPKLATWRKGDEFLAAREQSGVK